MRVKKFLKHVGPDSNYIVRVFDYDCSKIADNYLFYMFDSAKYSEVLKRKISFYTFMHDNKDTIIINIMLKNEAKE